MFLLLRRLPFFFWLPTFMLKLPILFFFSTCLILSTDSQCNDYRPTCPISPIGQDKCYYDGLISPPVNTTVYVGQTAVFYSKTLSQCSMRAYINNCRVQDDRHHSSTINNTIYSNCTISNVKISDDGTRIDMYIYGNGGINCYNPVFLTVIGLPPSPHNLTREIYCDKIIINGSLSENTTSIYIRIMQRNNTVFSKKESTFPINISESVFEYHHKYYKILVYNKNPAGLSQQYFEMDLHFKDKIYFNVSSSSLEVVDNNVFLSITVQVNTSCPLSVPQQFNLSSNCSINNFYQVINGTVINKNGLIDLCVDLQLNKLNCTVTLTSGNHKVYVTKSTYEVQEVIISENTSTGYFSVNCTFLPGSLVKGCAIEVFNDTGDFLFSQNISRLSSTSLYAVDNSSTCLTSNGTYIIYVYIWGKYGRVNKSLEVAQRLLTVILGCKKGQDIITISVTMATTIPTTSVSTTLSSITSTQILYYNVGCVGGVIILIVILILSCCCCCVLHYRKKKGNLIMADGKVMYNVDQEMVTISQDNTGSTPADVIEVKPEVDTQPHEQNITVSTNKSEHVTSTGDPSSTYPTDNFEAQGLNETEIISVDTQEIEISSNTTVQPHVIQTSISQPVQSPISESATFQTDNSETPLLKQSVTSQPVQSLNSDAATFPTDGSEIPLLKQEDDTVDQFVYEHSYCIDETEATNQTTLMAPSINRQKVSVISEKDEQVLPSENITISSGGKPVVSDEGPSQTVYAPPSTFQLLPPEQSTIVSTVPTTPTIITQGFIFSTNVTK